MPVTTDQISAKVPIAVPVDAYLALQRQMQELRISILALAAESRYGLTERGIREALIEFAKSPRRPSRPETPAQDFRDISQDAYLFLERRLHNLRVLVLTEAVREVEAKQQSTSVDTESIQGVWNRISADSPLLQDVLIPEQFAASAARS